MKATKILAGMSAAAFAASMLTMVSASATNSDYYFFAQAYGWASASTAVAADATSATVTWDEPQVALVNLGYIGDESGSAVDATVVVDSIVVNDTYTVDVGATLVGNGDAGENGLANIWNDAGKADVVFETGDVGFYGNGGDWITFKVSGVEVDIYSLTYNLSEPSSTDPDPDPDPAPAEYYEYDLDMDTLVEQGPTKFNMFLMGDPEKDEAGPFNDQASELAKAVGVKMTIAIDEEAAQAHANGEVWSGAALVLCSDSVGWEGKEISFQEGVKDYTWEKVSDGVYQVIYMAPEGTSVFQDTDTYAQIGFQDWSGNDTTDMTVTGITLLSNEEIILAQPGEVEDGCPCGCDCTADTCDNWNEQLGQCDCGCCDPAEFTAFLMFTDANWGWGNWNSTDDPEAEGKGTDAYVTADELTYTVSISAEQVASWYDEAGNQVDPGTDGASPAPASGINVLNVDINGLADAVGASTAGLDLTTEEKMQLAKDAGIEISNVSITVDGQTIYTYDDADLVYGDIEGNGKIRLELFNAYGDSKETAPDEIKALAEELTANESIAVTFDITGIPDTKECTCDVCNPNPVDSNPTDSDESSEPTDSTESTASEADTDTTSSAASSSSKTDSKTDSNPSTGAAALGVVGVLLAGAAMVVTKKKD